jgi:4-hydroxyphenylpyruvate dioxygenase
MCIHPDLIFLFLVFVIHNYFHPLFLSFTICVKMPCRVAIASMSLGRAWNHDLHEKLSQASRVGFEGVEIFYEDLEYLAKRYDGDNEQNLLRAASQVKSWCDELNLRIIGLQPFMFYEGLIDRQEHQAKIEKLKVWFSIANLLGTDTIQIPSNFQPEGISGDIDLIVEDMVEVAELGLQQNPTIRFAYENLAWGTHVDTWEKLWDIVRRVDRPNFGCCLDTYNIAGRIWGDPTSPDGRMPNADAALKHSLEDLVRTVDVRKIFYLQASDGERLETALVKGHPFHVDGQPARMNWSRNARLFLYEQDKGGYLPVVDVMRCFIKELGFEGWVSMELFSRTMSDPDPSVPRTHAERGIKSWRSLVEDLAL